MAYLQWMLPVHLHLYVCLVSMVTSSGVMTSVFLQSPSAVYRFTATIPPNCTSNCDYFLGIRTNDNDPTYLDFMLEGSTTGWIGVGFAPAQAMVK